MEKCLSAWPGPRAASPLIIESANMSSSWGRNGTVLSRCEGKSEQDKMKGSHDLGSEGIELQGQAFGDRDVQEGEGASLVVLH